MKVIAVQMEGFYFFGFEVKLLEEIGFDLNNCMKPYKPTTDTYLAVKNPKPVEATESRLVLLRDLKYKMNAIKIEGVD